LCGWLFAGSQLASNRRRLTGSGLKICSNSFCANVAGGVTTGCGAGGCAAVEQPAEAVARF